MPRLLAGEDEGAAEGGGYEALLFIHGFNSDVDSVVCLVGQLLSLGSFPPSIMATIFAWPCTASISYPLVRPPTTLL